MNKKIVLYSILIIAIIILSYHTTLYAVRLSQDEYSCKDTSKHWESIFEGIGIRTQVVYGSDFTECIAHCWLRLHKFGNIYEFESTSVKFKDVSADWNVDKVTEGWVLV